MTRKRAPRIVASIAVLGLVAAACGGNDDDAEPADEPAAEPAAEPADEPAEEPTDEGDHAGHDLSGVCPSPLVIQTDWFPESEHGTLYEMVGDDYVVDVEGRRVEGSLVVAGGTVDTGIDIQVRAGGPAIGFSAPRVQMYADDSIHIGYSSNDGAILATEDAPTIAVMAPLEKNPQIVMWDPETYPDVETIADLKPLGVTVNVFAGGTFPDVFVAQGILDAEQIDPSYDGSPSRFIAEAGAIAQQGFASAEPYNYENVFEEWGKPVKFQLIHDAGFQIYSQPLAVKTGDVETLRPCLEKFIPIAQQATIDFANSPDRAIGVIIDTVAQFDDFWVYDEGVANFSVQTMKDLGLKGNGPDSTVGNFDLDRVQAAIDAMASAGMDVPEGLTAEQLVTNEFIDESIGF